MENSTGKDHLATGALGESEILFQAVTHLGPAGAAIVIFPFLTRFVGASIPFILLICLAALILTGLCVSALAQRLPSAGGFFTYVSKGLGRRMGFFTAWAYFLYDPLIPTASVLIAAGIMEQVFKENLGVSVPWWITTLVMLAIVHAVTYWGIKQSARLNLFLGVTECLIVFALSIGIIWHAGLQAQSMEPFRFPTLGLQPLSLAFAFTMLMFCGFESAAPLAEEAADPKRAIPRTMILSLLVVGALWVVSGYALVLGFGISQAHQMLQAAENPFFSLSRTVWGNFGWLLVLFALVNSSLAASIAGQNAGSRVIFALGRAGVLSPRLGNIHPQHKTPSTAIFGQSALNVAASLALGFWLGPIPALGFIGILISIGIIVVYMLGNISVIPLYRGRFRSSWHPVRHGVVPVLGTLLLGFALYCTVWPLPPHPMSLAEIFVGLWFVIGAALAVHLGRGSSGAALERAAAIMYQGATD